MKKSTMFFCVLIAFFSYTNIIAQLDSNSVLCIDTREAFVDSSIKYQNITIIYKGDTTKNLAYYKQGVPIFREFGTTKIEYKFDIKSKQLISFEEIEYSNIKKEVIDKKYCLTCFYDNKNNLIRQVYKTINNNQEKIYVDSIFYFNNNDSIFFKGGYTSIATSENISENIKKRIEKNKGIDGSENYRIQLFVRGKPISSQEFSENKLSSGIIYIYDDNDLLETLIFVRYDKNGEMEVEYLSKFYYENGKLTTEKKYYGNDRKKDSNMVYFYNERGLIEKIIEDIFNPNEQRIYLYEYEYW